MSIGLRIENLMAVASSALALPGGLVGLLVLVLLVVLIVYFIRHV